MDSYMNSYTNKHNMAIRLFQYGDQGVSDPKRRRRLRLWRCGSGQSCPTLLATTLSKTRSSTFGMFRGTGRQSKALAGN